MRACSARTVLARFSWTAHGTGFRLERREPRSPLKVRATSGLGYAFRPLGSGLTVGRAEFRRRGSTEMISTPTLCEQSTTPLRVLTTNARVKTYAVQIAGSSSCVIDAGPQVGQEVMDNPGYPSISRRGRVYGTEATVAELPMTSAWSVVASFGRHVTTRDNPCRRRGVSISAEVDSGYPSRSTRVLTRGGRWSRIAGSCQQVARSGEPPRCLHPPRRQAVVFAPPANNQPTS